MLGDISYTKLYNAHQSGLPGFVLIHKGRSFPHQLEDNLKQETDNI